MKKLAGFLGVFAVLVVSAPLAHANIVLAYSSTMGAPTDCLPVGATPTLATCFPVATGVGGGITVTQFTGTSNSPGTAGLSFQSGSVVDITTTGAGDLWLWISAPDFVRPITPPDLIDSTSLTIIPTFGTGSASLASCVDQSNGVTPSAAFCSSPATGVPAGGITQSTTYSGVTSLASNKSTTITSLVPTGGVGTPHTFSLTQFVKIHFDGASMIQVQTRQVLTATPEPASIMLLGTATLGIISLLRKRKLANRS